jgi:hypothetical protein
MVAMAITFLPGACAHAGPAHKIQNEESSDMLKNVLPGFALIFFATQAYAQPIKLHPANPHYFLFNGQPTLLITSAEHYGAVINKDFDYVPYLDELKAYGLNYTRIYPGAMFEPLGKFIKGNPLGPRPQSLILPWARSSEQSYLFGGNKFDLDKWDPAYFARLKDFIAKAGERGIVVEVCFFNSQYSDSWPLSPLYYENNIQGVGKCDYEDAQTLKRPDVVKRESDYISKITQEVNAFDNIILEICDEPSLFVPHADAGPWVGHLLQVVHDTESKLPKKHMVAQEEEGPIGGPIDFSGSPLLSVIVGQYVWEGGMEQLGGMRALDTEYHHNKVIELNETAWYPIGYKGDVVAASRVEGWEFIVGGGAGFNHLNGRFVPGDPAGKTPDNAQVLGALHNLKEFMYSFDFLKMRPDRNFVVSGIPKGVYCRGISQPGEQYALYHHHSQLEERNHYYIVTPGNYLETLVLNLPGNMYTADWVDAASGSVLDTVKFTHQGGDHPFITPRHSVDIALRIKRVH